MFDSRSKALNLAKGIVLLVFFSYAIRLIIMREGWVPFGDQREYVHGWPPFLFGLMILLSLGSLVVDSFMRQAGVSASACFIVRSFGFGVVIAWGVLRFINIA